MKISKWMGALLATAWFVAGCGGGGNTLTGTVTKSTGTPAASVTVTSSAPSISADGKVNATITALVLDANNAAITNAAVTFSASAGAALENISATTGVSGTATATLTANGAAAGTAITVTASVGSAKGSTVVTVVTSAGGTTKVTLSTSAPQIPSSGIRSATIAAIVLDQNNNAVPGATVAFSATSGVITGSPATTSNSGVAVVSLNSGLDPSDRRIVVTATVNGSSQTVPVDVVGTNLTITGVGQLSLNTTASYTVSLTDSSGTPIANTAVALVSANGNTLSASSVTTDANGQAAFSVKGTSTGNNGVDTITATALGAVAKQAINVSSQNFSLSVPSTAVPICLSQPCANNTVQTLTASWLSNNAPLSGQTVAFSATRGTLSATSATTDSNGNATVTISSTSAGGSLVTATGSGVAAQGTINFVATVPSQVSVQASPAAVLINGQSVITATLRDANNNLVAGQTVTFSLNDVTGGQLSASTATTNAQGVAQVSYTAGSTSSSANGVVVTATAGSVPVTGTVALTVGGQTVFLSMGTGNTVLAIDAATYGIQYSIFAVDAQGGPVANIPVTVKVLPYEYLKGGRLWNSAASTWVTIPSVTSPNLDAPIGQSGSDLFCANEDTDFSGNINSLPNKDYNQDGILEPGNVAVVSPVSGTTNSNGELLVTVAYPKDHAYYVGVTLVATATVQGTQSSTSTTFVLPGAAVDFSTQTTQPPGPTSPYGTAASCAAPN